MSVSVSQIGIGRSLDRSIDQSPVSFSISLSVSVGACTKNNTRPRALISVVRSSALSTSSLSLHFIPSTSRASIPPIHEVATFILRTERIALPILERLHILSIAFAHIKHWTNPRTRRRIHDVERAKSCDRESANEMQRSTMKKAEKVGQKGGRCHRRPTWVPRTKLTRYVNCLSNFLLVYIQIYKYIKHIYVHTHICVRVLCMYGMCVR